MPRLAHSCCGVCNRKFSEYRPKDFLSKRKIAVMCHKIMSIVEIKQMDICLSCKEKYFPKSLESDKKSLNSL